MTHYRFVWSSFLGYPLQIKKGELVEALIFGKHRATLVRRLADGKVFVVDRYALRRNRIGLELLERRKLTSSDYCRRDTSQSVLNV